MPLSQLTFPPEKLAKVKELIAGIRKANKKVPSFRCCIWHRNILADG